MTSVRSVSTSVYLMLWALHVPVQHGTCVLSSTRTTVECCVCVCIVWVMYWVWIC